MSQVPRPRTHFTHTHDTESRVQNYYASGLAGTGRSFTVISRNRASSPALARRPLQPQRWDHRHLRHNPRDAAPCGARPRIPFSSPCSQSRVRRSIPRHRHEAPAQASSLAAKCLSRSDRSHVPGLTRGPGSAHEYHGVWHRGQALLLAVWNHLNKQAEWKRCRQVWHARRGSEPLTRCMTV